jgi:hypothetical protein
VSDYSIDELCACVRREISQRKRVYRRLVAEGKLDADTAAREIAMMEAIRDNLESQQQPRLF